MVFTDSTFRFFSLVQSHVRTSLAESPTETPYSYREEFFFEAYDVIRRIWSKRESQRAVGSSLSISRKTLKELENNFARYGCLGLLNSLTFVDVNARLERLTKLIRNARPHANTSYVVQLADALEIPGATMEMAYRIQRSHGYGQRLTSKERSFYEELQKILTSFSQIKSHNRNYGHDPSNRAKTFHDFQRDVFQRRIELFKSLNACEKKRQTRLILNCFGIQSSRFYYLRERYLCYGIWGLIDVIHASGKQGEKISPETELQIIEQRLMNPSLSGQKMIKHLKLKCGRENVQKIFARWRLSGFKEAKSIRGILPSPPQVKENKVSAVEKSARTRFPNLVKTAGLSVNRGFTALVKRLKYHKVPVSNPGALILAPFLEQLGIVEAVYTYGPPTYRTTEITNDVLVNVLRIVTGFPTINSLMLNSDHSVSIGAGLALKPVKSVLYRNLEDFRFSHLAKLRNDVARRARELNVINGKEIALDYHCDPSDSRYPKEKGITKAPDKNGDMVYAHRPQIIWDSDTNSLVNIAYCEGRSRAPSALYKFCEENLFQIIDPSTVSEIYADSEYTGEKQLIYLVVRSNASVTMCLKQNKKIKRWKEEVVKEGQWTSYNEIYRIAGKDFVLPETGKLLRFVVKQNKETQETRCFGSTHMDWSLCKILDKYHIRWTVESGIKDLVENYFLNYPTGNSPEKVEFHYYSVMIARILFDYFMATFNELKFKTPEGWNSVLSTIRTSIFANQNCELSMDDSGDFLLTYLDGDPSGLKKKVASLLENRKSAGLNKVSWWAGRGLKIKIENRFDLESGAEIH